MRGATGASADAQPASMSPSAASSPSVLAGVIQAPIVETSTPLLGGQHPPDAAPALDPEAAVAHDQRRALVDAEPAADEPGFDGSDQAREHAALGDVHLDGDVDQADAGLDLELEPRLRRVLRCDDHAADARAAPERSLGSDHRAGRDAEVGHAAGDEPTQLAEHRLEAGAHLFDEAAAHSDAVDVGDRGEPDRLARSPGGQVHLDLVAAAGRDQEIGERRGLLVGLGVQRDHGDARPRATRRAAPQDGLGDEGRVQRGIRAGGRAAADEVHAHAAPSLVVTGGSDDHGKTIQSSVLR